MQQIDLFLPDGGHRLPSVGDLEPIPDGPYAVSKTWDLTYVRYTPPYTVTAGDPARTIVGHIDNLAVALRISEMLNLHGPGDAAATGEHP